MTLRPDRWSYRAHVARLLLVCLIGATAILGPLALVARALIAEGERAPTVLERMH